jgi:hypothetical protein
MSTRGFARRKRSPGARVLAIAFALLAYTGCTAAGSRKNFASQAPLEGVALSR